jgi:4-amino-4-deoxy-L-arabinose transferase-like glycosyltransferase
LPPLLGILFGGVFTLASAWALGSVAARRLPLPHPLRLALGGVILSTVVYALLLAGVFHWGVVLAIGGLALAGTLVVARTDMPGKEDLPRAVMVVLAIYGVFYFVNALAPETVADGITYHLGLVSEYVRERAFPDRIAFYELVPQGMEMLFCAAFAFGRHSAAKLVEFGFFLATVPLLLRIAGRLAVPRLAAAVAIVLYFCAPVVGITATSTYNDPAQVFFALAAFYLLLLWQESGDARYLLPAGLLAGFCYAIKMPGLLVPAVAGAWLLWTRHWKAASIFTAGAAIAIAPWMVRSLVLTGNPFAPMLDSLFPNPYFHIATERGLAADLRSLGSVPWWRVPWELAVGGTLTGSYGPLLLGAPLMLVGWRTRAGRLCCVFSAVLALPWFTNTGARFIMLAVPFVGLGIGMGALILGRRVAWAAIAVQTVLCFPPVIDLYETRYGFRLHEFPIAAALRIEAEDDYLKARLDEYKVAGLLRYATPPGSRILALVSVATAYVDRDVSVYWQSAEADRMLDTLRVAGLYGGSPLYEVRGDWPARPLRAVRVRLPQANANEWCVHEFSVTSPAGTVAPGRNWALNAWPNPSEVPFALDRNTATRWRTWEPMRSGMFVEIELDSPQQLNGASIMSHTPVFQVPMEFFGQTAGGSWISLTSSPRVSLLPREDLRLAATHALRAAGYGYLLVPEGSEGNGPIGRVMVGHEAEWGLERAGSAGSIHLFRLK